MSTEDRRAAAPPSRWQWRETWIVGVLVAVFLLFGLRTYNERSIIAQADRLKEDLRIFSLAINTYRNEEGAYPAPEANDPALMPSLPSALTTPVAYSNRLMSDPFDPNSEDGEALRYLRREDGATTEGESTFDAFVRNQIGEPVEDVGYVLWSRGPDGDLDTRRTEGDHIETVRYDPTNGARSNGDLIFWGPAIGIRRNPYEGTAAAGLGPLQ